MSEEELPRYERGARKWAEPEGEVVEYDEGLPVILPSGEVSHKRTVEGGEVISKKRQRRVDKMLKDAEKKIKKQNIARQPKASEELEAEEKGEGKVEAIDYKFLGRCHSRESSMKSISALCDFVMSDAEKRFARVESLLALAKLCLGLGSTRRAKEIFVLPQVERRPIGLMALASTSVLVRDALPGFALSRQALDGPSDVRLSKKVEGVRLFERSLVDAHKKLFDILLDKTFISQNQNLSLTSCCQILEASPDFNGNEPLLWAVATYANVDSLVSDLCASTLGTIMRNDLSLERTLRIVQATADIASGNGKLPSGRQVRISGKLVDAIANAKFLEKEEAAKVELNQHGLDDGRLKLLTKDTKRDLMSTTLHGDLERLRKNEAEILRLLFIIFVKILRSSSAVHATDLVEGAIRGIGTHANFVNFDLLLELLQELKKVATAPNATSRIILMASRAALKLLQIKFPDVAEVNTDWVIDGVATALRHSLLDLATCVSLRADVPINRLRTCDRLNWHELASSEISSDASLLFLDIVDCAESILSSPAFVPDGQMGITALRGGSSEALAGLISALLEAPMHADADISRAALRTIRNLFGKFPRLAGLVDVDGIIIPGSSEPKTAFWQFHCVASFPDSQRTIQSLAACGGPHVASLFEPKPVSQF